MKPHFETLHAAAGSRSPSPAPNGSGERPARAAAATTSRTTRPRHARTASARPRPYPVRPRTSDSRNPGRDPHFRHPHAAASEPTPRAGVAAAPAPRPWRTRPVDRERAASKRRRRQDKRKRGASTDPPTAREPLPPTGGSCGVQRLLVLARARLPSKDLPVGRSRDRTASAVGPSRVLPTSPHCQTTRIWIRVLTPFTRPEAAERPDRLQSRLSSADSSMNTTPPEFTNPTGCTDSAACGVPKSASYLQITGFSGCASNFDTPHAVGKRAVADDLARVAPYPDGIVGARIPVTSNTPRPVVNVQVVSWPLSALTSRPGADVTIVSPFKTIV
jgi:hypothetical protein